MDGEHRAAVILVRRLPVAACLRLVAAFPPVAADRLRPAVADRLLGAVVPAAAVAVRRRGGPSRRGGVGLFSCGFRSVPGWIIVSDTRRRSLSTANTQTVTTSPTATTS